MSDPHTHPPLVAIVGPTATGKTGLGISLAQAHIGEIVSADSVQVYRELTIGSDKVLPKETAGIPHHMLDVVPAGTSFPVTEYQRHARSCIATIHQHQNIPFLVGGTGYYIQAVVDGITFPDVPPNPQLREKLQHEHTEDLAQKLYQLDQHRYATIDRNNRRRLIRAIEIAETYGYVPRLKTHTPYTPLLIGLDLPDAVLRQRITTRLKDHVARGLFDEVHAIRKYVPDAWLISVGLEYKHAIHYLNGKYATEDEFLDTLSTKIWQYAKRQRTWFKKDTRINWYHPEDATEISQRVSQFLARHTYE